MLESLSDIVIVPARSASKRLPGKNMMELDGKPLICHTLDNLIYYFDKTIFSSDDEDMISFVNTYYMEAIDDQVLLADVRPSILSADNSKVIDTIVYYFYLYGSLYDRIWLCLPTCPLRSRQDIAECKILLDENIDGVISITDYEFPPALGMTVSCDGLVTDWHGSKPWKSGNTRSQDHEKVFRPNGGIYGMWMDSFDRYRSFYNGIIKSYYMPRDRSVDIDTIIDFITAESIIKNERDKTV